MAEIPQRYCKQGWIVSVVKWATSSKDCWCYLSLIHHKGWSSTQQQAHRYFSLVSMQTGGSWHTPYAPLDTCQRSGHSKVYIRTVDTDVVVLTISHFHDMSLSELWVGLGSGKTFREIPIHVITEQLGTQRCQAPPLFHAYTGCDMTSSMFGIGKKTAWTAWNAFPDATDTL